MNKTENETLDDLALKLNEKEFIYLDKKYYCVSNKIMYGNKLIIKTLSITLSLYLSDVLKIVILAKKIKTKKPSYHRSMPRQTPAYSFLDLLEIITKPDDESWAKLAIRIGRPNYRLAVYQQFVKFKEKSTETGLSMFELLLQSKYYETYLFKIKPEIIEI